CDTEEQKRWKAKIRRYVAWSNPAPDGTPSPFTTLYGTSHPLLAVVVAPRKTTRAEARCETLLAWTEQELEALGRPADGAHMSFSYLPPATEPVKLFLGAKSWYRPFAEDTFPLLAGLPAPVSTA